MDVISVASEIAIPFAFLIMAHHTKFLNVLYSVIQMIAIFMIQFCEVAVSIHFIPINHAWESQSAIYVFTNHTFESNHTWPGSAVSVTG